MIDLERAANWRAPRAAKVLGTPLPLTTSLKAGVGILTPLPQGPKLNFTGTWLGFRSRAITGAKYWILKKNKALVVSRSEIVNPPHGDLVLSRVSIRANPNLDILGMKFDSKPTFEDHVRGIVFRVSQRIDILRFVNLYLWTILCYFVEILHLFSKSSSIVIRFGGQLLNITFSFLSARCIRWSGFVLISVAGMSMLIRTPIAVCLESFHLQIPVLRPQLIHWSENYQCVERPNCRSWFKCGPNQPHLLNKYQINRGSYLFMNLKSYLGRTYWHHIK